MTILENISPDAIVFLQTHKRIWPASQRDAVFWSHMKTIKDDLVDKEAHDEWVVCNHSIEHESYPVRTCFDSVSNIQLVIRPLLSKSLIC